MTNWEEEQKRLETEDDHVHRPNSLTICNECGKGIDAINLVNDPHNCDKCEKVFCSTTCENEHQCNE